MERPDKIYNSIFRLYTEINLGQHLGSKTRDEIVEDEEINRMLPIKRAELLMGAELFATKCKDLFEKMPKYNID